VVVGAEECVVVCAADELTTTLEAVVDSEDVAVDAWVVVIVPEFESIPPPPPPPPPFLPPMTPPTMTPTTAAMMTKTRNIPFFVRQKGCS